MTSFNYKARDHYGLLVSGQLEAENSKAAARELERLGFTPVSILEVETGTAFLKLEEWFSTFQQIRTEELIVFTRQLASILDAGVPLIDGLGAIAEQIQIRKFRAVILQVKRDIEGGATFSDALDKHRRIFSPLIVNMVRAGERAGILPQVLDRVSNLLEKDLETKNKIKNAVRYPALVLFTLTVAFVIMIVYVIPRFAHFFAAFKTELPWPTRLLIGINFIITNYWYWFLGIIFIGIYSFREVIETEKGRYRWDRFLLSLPVFGPLFLRIYLSRFGRMLAAMLQSGIPILEALTITSATVENRVISRVIIDIRNEVSQGKDLAEPMKGSQVFPPIAISMVAIGEKAGSLESMLNKVADYFDREADYTIRNLLPLLEPLLIFGLALMVLIFALGIFLPMWDLIKVYRTF